MRFDIVVELINGIKIGLEHLRNFSEEDDDVDYLIILDVVILRFSFIKYL